MREEQLKKWIRQAAEKDVPDLKQRIKKDPRFIHKPARSFRFPSLRPMRVLTYALAAVVVVALLYTGLRTEDEVHATIHLSYNPAVAIDVDEQWKVLGIIPFNADAEALLASLPAMRGKSFDDAFDRLSEEALAAGYIEAGAQITIAMERVKGDETSLREHVENRVRDHGFHPLVESLIDIREDASERARDRGIGLPAMVLIDRIIEREPEKHDVEDLITKRLPELREILRDVETPDADMYAKVHLSYNPAFALSLDRNRKVLDVVASNAKAMAIVQTLPSLRGEHLDDVFERLTDAASPPSDVDATQGEITFAIEMFQAEGDVSELKGHLERLIKGRGFIPVYQDLQDAPSDLASRAEDRNIGLPAMALIDRIVERQPERYDVDDLIEKRLSELRSILQSLDDETRPDTDTGIDD